MNGMQRVNTKTDALKKYLLFDRRYDKRNDFEIFQKGKDEDIKPTGGVKYITRNSVKSGGRYQPRSQSVSRLAHRHNSGF